MSFDESTLSIFLFSHFYSLNFRSVPLVKNFRGSWRSVRDSTGTNKLLCAFVSCDQISISTQFQIISWPIASQLQRKEEMEIQVLAFNRFLNNRLLGYANLSLQRLLDENQIQLAVSLLDVNGRPLKVSRYLCFWRKKDSKLEFT